MNLLDLFIALKRWAKTGASLRDASQFKIQFLAKVEKKQIPRFARDDK